MNYATINPFYAARQYRPASEPTAEPYKPVFVKLPRAPINASPVPGLTSLYHNAEAGDYGNRGYPGNCSGNLIKDLLAYFRPGLLCDPMAGSGTCADVCDELGIACLHFDIHRGFDACDPNDFTAVDMFDFIWAHPPYFRQKLYSDNPCDLSRSPTLEHFLKRYGQFVRNCAAHLSRAVDWQF